MYKGLPTGLLGTLFVISVSFSLADFIPFFFLVNIRSWNTGGILEYWNAKAQQLRTSD